jgi:hypothetical protein
MKVLFVSMPFAAIRPAIGVSLLKSHLCKMGVPARVLYLNMRFARVFGGGDRGHPGGYFETRGP